MKIKIECRNTKMEKVAGCLEKLLSQYKIWLYDDRIFAYFKTKSISDFKELTTRFKHRNIEFKFHRIEKVESWLKRLLAFKL
jgi:hypothetical protein